MPKFVPIIVSIQGGGDVEVAIAKMTDAFTKMNEESKKAGESAAKSREQARAAAKEKADLEKEAARNAQQSFQQQMIAAQLYYAAIREGIQWIKQITTETIQYAARTEQLNYSISALAKASNTSLVSLQAQTEAIHSMGVATQSALQLLNKMAVAELDTANATKLVTVAQNLSVVAGISVNEEMDKLLRGIVTQQPRILRTAGVFLQIKDVLGEVAKAQGRSTASFTEAEKQQALLNAVIEYGSRVTGAYSESLKGALTATNELDKAQGDFSNSFGGLFLGDYVKGVKTATSFYEILAKYPKTVLSITEAVIALGLAFIFVNTTLIPKLISNVTFLAEGFVNLIRTMRGVQTTAMATGAAMGALAGGITLVVAAFFALMAVMDYYKEWNENSKKTIEINQSLFESSLKKTSAQEKDADSLARMQPLLKTTIENMGKLRAQYAGLNETMAEESTNAGKFGIAGGFDTDRIKQTIIGGAIKSEELILTGGSFSKLSNAYKDSAIHDQQQKLLNDQTKLAAGLANDPSWKIQSQNLASVATAYKMTAEEVYKYAAGIKDVTEIDKQNIKTVQDAINEKNREANAWKTAADSIAYYNEEVEKGTKLQPANMQAGSEGSLRTTIRDFNLEIKNFKEGQKLGSADPINPENMQREIAAKYQKSILEIDKLVKETAHVFKRTYNEELSHLMKAYPDIVDPSLVALIKLAAEMKSTEKDVESLSDVIEKNRQRFEQLEAQIRNSRAAIAALKSGKSDENASDLEAISLKQKVDLMRQAYKNETLLGIEHKGITDNLQALERYNLKLSEILTAKKNIEKESNAQFLAEIKLAEAIAKSWIPVVNAETRAAQGFVDYINKARDAEVQLTADIAVELEKRAHFAMTLNQQIAMAQAEVYLNHLQDQSKAQSELLKDFAEMADQAGDQFKYNSLITQAKGASEATVTSLITNTNEILSGSILSTLNGILSKLGGHPTMPGGSAGTAAGAFNGALSGNTDRQAVNQLNAEFNKIAGMTYEQWMVLSLTSKDTALAIEKAVHQTVNDANTARTRHLEMVAKTGVDSRPNNLQDAFDRHKQAADDARDYAIAVTNINELRDAQETLDDLRKHDTADLTFLFQQSEKNKTEAAAATLKTLLILQHEEETNYYNSLQYQQQLTDKFEIERRTARQQSVDNIKKLEDELKHVNDNNANEYKEVWLKAQLDVANGHKNAIKEQITAQAQLTQKTVYDADIVRAKVLTEMARSTKSVNDMFADAYTGTINAITSTMDASISKITAKMGAFGGVLKGILNDLSKMILNRVFTRLLDAMLPPTSAGTGSGGGSPAGGFGGSGGGSGTNGGFGAALPNVITSIGGIGSQLLNSGARSAMSEQIPGGGGATSAGGGIFNQVTGALGGVGGKLGGIGNIAKLGGGLFGKIGGLLGLGGKIAGPGANFATEGSSIAASLGMGGAEAGVGAAASGGLGSLLMGAAGGPIGLAITGAMIAIPLIAGLFANGTEKALRDAIQGKYQVYIKDMKTLTGIKQIGEQAFGIGNVKNHIQETIAIPEIQQMIAAYGRSTGQGNASIVKSFALADPGNSANIFNRLPKYDVGTSYVPVTGPAIVHQGEAIIPASMNNGGTMARLEATIARLEAKMNVMSAGDVFGIGADQNPHAASDAVIASTSMDADRGNKVKNNLGLNRY